MATPDTKSILSHWGTLVDGLHTSSLDFYASVETTLRSRKVPDIRFSRVTHSESGVLSAKREYLRVSRHHLLYDICAAPFGTGFFFSWWEVVPRLRFGFLFGLIFLVFTIAVFFLGPRLLPRQVLYLFGASPVIASVLVVILAWVLVGVLARSGVRWFEDFLLAIPLVGAIYVRLFRPATYYELDTIAMYRAVVHGVITETVEGLTKAQGIRSLSAEDQKPVLREFYRR